MSEVLREYAMHCRDLAPKEVAALVIRGIHPDALGWGNGQFAVKAAYVRWEGALWFDFATEHDGGQRAAVIMCLDEGGQAADLAAWSLAAGRLALRAGTVAMIGQEQISLPRVDGDRLWVHPSPVEWLEHRRVGVVIINYEMARPALVAASPLAVKTREHKAKLEERWRAPRVQVFDVGVAEAIAS